MATINPSTVHISGAGSEGEYRSFTGPEGVPAAHNTREFIQKLEKSLGLPSPDQAPPTSSHALVFRLVSALLATQVNDRRTWDCRNEVASEDFGPFNHGWINKFGAREDASSIHLEGWEAGLAERHFWGVTRGDEPVALLSVEGILYRPEARFDLNVEYRRAGSRLLPVLVATLGDVLS